MELMFCLDRTLDAASPTDSAHDANLSTVGASGPNNAGSMSSATPRTAAPYLRPLVRALDAKRIDTDALLERHGLSRRELADASTRIPVQVTSALLDDAVSVLEDPALGLTLTRYSEYSAFGALGVALAAGGSLRAVLHRVVRYHAIVSDAIASRLVDRGDALVVELTDRTPIAAHPQSLLYVVATLVGLVRLRLSRTTNPRRVVVRDVDDACAAAASRYFRCPIERGAFFAVEYSAADGARLLEGSDPEMAAMLEQALAARLASDDASLATSLAIYLEGRFPEGEPSLAEAAKAMGTSERSLQRRLRDAGLSYQKVVDDTRRALADRHLHDPSLSLTELAFLLGFADASSLSRAFRKWYGTPARTLRKNRG